MSLSRIKADMKSPFQSWFISKDKKSREWEEGLPQVKKKFGNQNIFILGTAHISQKSVEAVEKIASHEKTSMVSVELCPSRYQSIMDKDRWRKLDIVTVIRTKKIYLLMSSIILSAFQKQMGEKMDVKPGQEMITALEIAQRREIPIGLVDRDIQITLKRAWQKMGFWGKMFLFSEILAGLLFRFELEEAEVEKMKEKDVLEQLLDNLPKRYAHVKEIIIDERDRYLAQKIKEEARKNLDAKNILAVVGAGHLRGIDRYFSEDLDLKPLEEVQQKSVWGGLIRFFTPIFLIMVLFYWVSDTSDMKTIMESIYAWIVIKAVVSFLFAAVILAHPVALLGALLTAPISNFNPILKPGWVSGLAEAHFRKPTVEDFENIATDISSWKGFFHNKVLRIFWLVLMPQMGSSIGTGIALWYISQL